MNNEAYTRLLDIADEMPIIDTHEHLPLEGNLHEECPWPDVLSHYLTHYVSTDLLAAGLPQENLRAIRDGSLDLMERWALLEPWMEQVRSGSYYRSLRIAMQKIHGIDDMNRDTIQALNESFIRAVADSGYKRRIVKDMCHIERCITCEGDDEDYSGPDEFRARAFYPEAWALPWIVNVRQKTLKEYCEAFKEEYRRWRACGAVALKIGIAYNRPILIEDVPFAYAEALFDAHEIGSRRFPVPLQDFYAPLRAFPGRRGRLRGADPHRPAGGARQRHRAKPSEATPCCSGSSSPSIPTSPSTCSISAIPGGGRFLPLRNIFRMSMPTCAGRTSFRPRPPANFSAKPWTSCPTPSSLRSAATTNSSTASWGTWPWPRKISAKCSRRK